MTPLLTILIPTFRNPQVVGNCVGSMLINTEFPYRIVVLNNDASTGGREVLESLFSGCSYEFFRLRHLAANRGWMGAINLGMEDVDTPFVCLLNDDVLFVPGQPDFWRRLLECMNPTTGAVGPASNFVMGLQALQLYNTPPTCFVKYLIGFCLMMRTEVFRDVGMLDESLPGGDDLDLSIRLRAKGLDLICERTAYLHHIGSVTGNNVHGNYWNSMWQQDQSNNALIRKHGVRTWFDTVCGGVVESLQGPAYETLMQHEGDWVKRHTPEGMKGLNVGCGSNEGNEWGLDVRRPGERGAGGTKWYAAQPTLVADALEIPVMDGSLDYLVASHILEHLVDPFQALREWKRVLKPQGMVIVTLPDHSRMQTILMDYTHVHAFTPQSATTLFEAAGWKVKEMEHFPIGHFGMVVEVGR